MSYFTDGKFKRLIFAALFCYSAAYIYLAFSPLNNTLKLRIEVIMFLFPVLLLALAGINEIRKRKLPDVLLGGGLLLFAAGELVRMYYAFFLLELEPPYPSYADVFYLTGYILLLSYTFRLSGLNRESILKRNRYFLDVAVISMLLFVFLWIGVIHPAVADSEGAGTAEILFNVAYPLFDFFIICLLVMAVYGFKKGRWTYQEKHFFSGMTFIAVADVLFNLQAYSNTYLPDSLVSSVTDVLWMLAYFIFFVASSSSRADERTASHTEIESEENPWLELFSNIILPGIVLLMIPILMILATAYFPSGPDYWLLIITATSIAMMVLVRTGILYAENRHLFSKVITDSLTGVYNHRFFHEQLEKETARARRYGGVLTLATLDLDDFSDINNTYGHVVGDEVLVRVARILMQMTRNTDYIARIGGDEFAVIMPETDTSEAVSVIDRVKTELNKNLNVKGRSVTASFGIASFPEHADSKKKLVKNADSALYWAKYHGKDGIFIYDPKIDAQSPGKRIELVRQQAYLNTVRALAAAVDARDPYTRHHSQNVAKLAVKLGERLGFNQERLKLLEMAALLHDVGKIGIHDSILQKQDGLEPDEQDEIRMHPVLAAKILNKTNIKQIIPWVLAHHERWDGTGYPNGMSGEEIPVEARILAICDAYDAMTSDRPYRKSLSHTEALEELYRKAGTQFDPHLVSLFLDIMSEESGGSTAQSV